MNAAQEYVMQRSIPEPNSGCWLWSAAIAQSGYGYAHTPKDGRLGKSQYAHRISYWAFRGEVPEGLQLDHLCRNRACVNPDHLEPVTARVNNLRGVGAAARNARKTVCSNGHPFNAENTACTPQGSRKCRACTQPSGRPPSNDPKGSPLAAAFVELLWEEQRRLGLTDAELARRIGVNHAHLSRWKNKRRFPRVTLNIAHQIATRLPGLGVSIEFQPVAASEEGSAA